MRPELQDIEADVDAVASALTRILNRVGSRRGLSAGDLADKFDLLLETVCEDCFDDDLAAYSVIQTGATFKARPGVYMRAEQLQMEREYQAALEEYAAKFEDDDPAATVGDYRNDMMRGA